MFARLAHTPFINEMELFKLRINGNIIYIPPNQKKSFKKFPPSATRYLREPGKHRYIAFRVKAVLAL